MPIDNVSFVDVMRHLAAVAEARMELAVQISRNYPFPAEDIRYLVDMCNGDKVSVCQALDHAGAVNGGIYEAEQFILKRGS